MPDLGSNTPVGEIDRQRLIRLGNRIIYSNHPTLSHESIAHNEGVTETGPRNKLVVDDGAFFRFEDGILIADGETSSCIIRGDKDEARKETNRLIAEIRGQAIS